MKRWINSAVFAIGVSVPALAQPPQKLPDSLDKPIPRLDAKPAKPLSPSEAAKQRDDAIKAVKEELLSFDPFEVSASQKDSHWVIHTRKYVLKDFGNDRGAAQEAVQLIQALRVNQLGTVPGANPPFEYWLADGKAPRGTNAKLVVMPVSAKTLAAEPIGGAWMITDTQKGLYNFGKDGDAAKRAAIICWKYGFNQIAVMGAPQPTMIVPLVDARQAMLDKNSPAPNAMPLAVVGDADKTGLLLPGNVYAGPKMPLDLKKLDVKRDAKGWMLLHNGEELARFGADEPIARTALRTLQNARPSELVRLGEKGLPFFLEDGHAIRGEPLGVSKVTIRADLLKVQKVRETYWLYEEGRPLFEVGTKDDTEILVRVLRSYNIKSISTFGRQETGGLRLFTQGR